MPLLKRGRIVSDPWRKPVDDTTPPADFCILSLPRLQDDERFQTATHLHLGLILPIEQPADILGPYIDQLSLVAISFPTFRDGRGFTQARCLRERLSFPGEIRATGEILPDQYAFLLRCGVTTVEIPDGTISDQWRKAIDRFSLAYQASVLEEPILSGLSRTNVA